MQIIPHSNETFDAIIAKSANYSKALISAQLENYDDEIYSSIDKNRFKLIRIDTRTILTTIGIITFKHRYYYDNETKSRVYLLDNQIGIPKNVRMSNELLLKVLDFASEMTYANVGKRLSSEFVLSKFTIWRIIKNSVIETYYDREINRGNLKVHVQIDEKFVNIEETKKRKAKCTNKSKKRYYTLTIFAGTKRVGKKGKRMLLNKTLISSSSLSSLKEKLNELLETRYKLADDEEIFISGDYATYIQNFGEDIYWRSKYVPDKFHTVKAIKDVFPELILDKYTLNDPNFRELFLAKTKGMDDPEIAKVRRALRKNKNIFKPYLDHQYLGCSQEGQNSHVYAPRFGKYANRFNPKTIEKLSMVREAQAENAQIKVAHKKRFIEKKIELTNCLKIESILDEPLTIYLEQTKDNKKEFKILM